MARERKFTKDGLYELTKQLLLKHGYEGYTFTILARHLDISRAALYKYYDNKEELLMEYMVFEFQSYLDKIIKISNKKTFLEQLDELFDIIFKDMSLYQLRAIGMQIPTINKNVRRKKQRLSEIHTELYTSLEKFIALGRKEKILRDDIPSSIFLGLIFQTVNIPNIEGIPHQEWIEKLKVVVCHGMFT